MGKGKGGNKKWLGTVESGSPEREFCNRYRQEMSQVGYVMN